jgi:beta-mannosidase
VTWEGVSTPAAAYDGAPGDAVAWRPVELPAYGTDDDDHWFRTTIEAVDEAAVLRLGGLASVCDVFLDGDHVLQSESMFLEHELPVAAGAHELAVCARALAPLLAQRSRPRARWRTRVADNNLRRFRTTLLGRAPGFAPGPPVVGPWRPVEVVPAGRLRLGVRTWLDGEDGVVEVRCAAEAGPLEATLGSVTASLPAGGGSLRVPRPERWWPHTHGDPALHELRVRAAAGESSRRVGFRSLAHAPDLERDGLDLHLNGVAVFARGAVWVPPPAGEVRATLERARDAGLNMVRVVGTTWYESDGFFDACDELGLLVWQDLMFANMDYPFADEAFLALAEREVRQVFASLAGRPSLAVVCGNSEVEQQVAMLGLPPELGRDPFYTATVPALLREALLDAAYVPSAPTGGTFPFRTDRGVANYFGVGAYLRPLGDVRRAGVRFASECLAFANVPADDQPDRAAGVMRDVGAEWDFADVRDHYLRALHGVGPEDDGYWERARHVTGEVMAAVFGEWRRAESPCAGAIVLWLRDLVPGAGWGLLDHAGRPKLAWHYLRRALAPVAVWFVDEGLNGLALHAANDTAKPVAARLRLALYRGEGLLVESSEEMVTLAPHSSIERDVEAAIGRFVDVAYAYRFGEVQQDTVVATLEQDGAVLSQTFFYPVRKAVALRSADELGLVAEADRHPGGGVDVTLASAAVVRGVRLLADGLDPVDDGFDLEPGRTRRVALRAVDGDLPTLLRVSALELAVPLVVPVP